MNSKTLPLGPLAFFACLVSSAASCGGSSPNDNRTPNASSCDYRPTGKKGSVYCGEYVGDSVFVNNYKDTCALSPGAVWSDIGCPRENTIGACRTMRTDINITVTNWRYVGGDYADAAAYMAACTKDPLSVFVAP